jgi:hypothetical protein
MGELVAMERRLQTAPDKQVSLCPRSTPRMNPAMPAPADSAAES